jgi:hypothetical protein
VDPLTDTNSTTARGRLSFVWNGVDRVAEVVAVGVERRETRSVERGVFISTPRTRNRLLVEATLLPKCTCAYVR